MLSVFDIVFLCRNLGAPSHEAKKKNKSNFPHFFEYQIGHLNEILEFYDLLEQSRSCSTHQVFPVLLFGSSTWKMAVLIILID